MNNNNLLTKAITGCTAVIIFAGCSGTMPTNLQEPVKAGNLIFSHENLPFKCSDGSTCYATRNFTVEIIPLRESQSQSWKYVHQSGNDYRDMLNNDYAVTGTLGTWSNRYGYLQSTKDHKILIDYVNNAQNQSVFSVLVGCLSYESNCSFSKLEEIQVDLKSQLLDGIRTEGF